MIGDSPVGFGVVDLRERATSSRLSIYGAAQFADSLLTLERLERAHNQFGSSGTSSGALPSRTLPRGTGRARPSIRRDRQLPRSQSYGSGRGAAWGRWSVSRSARGRVIGCGQNRRRCYTAATRWVGPSSPAWAACKLTNFQVTPDCRQKNASAFCRSGRRDLVQASSCPESPPSPERKPEFY